MDNFASQQEFQSNLKETVLLTLISERKVGISAYELRRKFSEVTGARLSFGTLYPLLDGLLSRNLVSPRSEENRRRYWSITNEGSELLKRQVAFLQNFFSPREQVREVAAIAEVSN